MLHVFLVDTGMLFVFNMEIATESVGKLMEAVFQKTHIPLNKQVLLAANGEPLNPSHRVASYISSGTETQPIFLFSKSMIESTAPPSRSMNFGSEASVKEALDRSLKLPPTYDTLVSRAELASNFHAYAVELEKSCENLVSDQQLQKKGWEAVIANLDAITSAFQVHTAAFEHQCHEFVAAQGQYAGMLQNFESVLITLKRLPVLPCLAKSGPVERAASLLQWISNYDQQSSLENLVAQCYHAMKQFNPALLDELLDESKRILASSNNVSMKDIKGLVERLHSLDQRLAVVRQLVQDQADMSQGFQQNQMRAGHLGDASVLPDLCRSHQKQLLVLMKNHTQLRSIRDLCALAKDELSENLHVRLRWVMYMEKSICECDSKLLVYHESLKRMKKRFDIFEQICEAPRMYILAVLEVLRRKNFSDQFFEWSQGVSQSAAAARSEEISKRSNFSAVFGNHFLQSLFPGLDQMPLPFAETPPDSCDSQLPNISVDDIKLLQRQVPELMAELSLSDPLETSTIVKDRLSQSNLSKLVDPKQNKTLEQTLELRERACVNIKSKMTMSVLQREMSQDEGGLDFPGGVNWQVGLDDSSVSLPESEFELHSLRSLPDDKVMANSDDSDGLFQSAELEFSSPQHGSVSPESRASSKASSSPIPIKSPTRSIVDQFKGTRSRSLSPRVKSPSKTVKSIFSLPSLQRQQPSASSMCDRGDMDDASCSAKTSGSVVSKPRSALSEALSQSATQSLRETEDPARPCEHSCNFRAEMKTLTDECAKLRSSYASLQKALSAIRDVAENDFNDLKSNCLRGIRSLAQFQVGYSCEKCVQLLMESEKLKAVNSSVTSALHDRVSGLQAQLDSVSLENGVLQDKCAKQLVEITSAREAAEKCKSDYTGVIQTLKATVSELDSSLVKKESQVTTLRETNAKLNSEIEKLKDSFHASKDLALNSLNQKVKELTSSLAEKSSEISQLLRHKDNLENQLQTQFNTVLNKVKKERESQIKELQTRAELASSELSKKSKECDHVASELATGRQDIAALQIAVKDAGAKFNALDQEFETYKRRYMTLENEKYKLLERLQELESSLVACEVDRSRVVEEMRVNFEERLRSEKASVMLACELEKASALEELGKQDALGRPSRATSLEEGIDELEVEKLIEKVKFLESENRRLKASQSLDSSADDQSREQEVNTKRRLPTPYGVRLCTKDLKPGDLIMLIYNESSGHYTVSCSDDTKHFLHPDSVKGLHLTAETPADRKYWCLAYLTEKEYCVARKASNKFKLPVDTYFWRVQARPFDSS